MKLLYPLLAIATLCCFAPAMSNPVDKDKDDKDEDVPAARPNCLEKAMETNNQAVSVAMIKFICAYMKFKEWPDKDVFMKAIQELEDATKCKTEDIFGNIESLDDLAVDKSGVLTSQIINMKRLLDRVRSTNSDSQASLGGLVQKRFTRHLNNRQGGSSNLLGSVVDIVPNVLGSPLNLAGGLLGGGKSGGLLNGGLIGGLLTAPTDILGGLFGDTGRGQREANGGILSTVLNAPGDLLRGLTGGGGQNQAHGCGGSPSNPLGGLLGSLSGGGNNGLGGVLSNLVGAPLSLVSGLTGGGNNGLGGVLDSLVGTPLSLVNGLTGGGNNGLGGVLGNLVGAPLNLVSGLTGGGLLGGLTGGILGR